MSHELKRDSFRDKLLQRARTCIASLKLPSIVGQIFEGQGPFEELNFRCQRPERTLSEGTRLSPGFLPLWECGSVVTGYDSNQTEFAKIDLEEPSKAWFRSCHFEEVAADVLIDLWEDEVADDNLEKIAAAFEFERLPKLLRDLKTGPIGDYSGWRSQLRMGH